MQHDNRVSVNETNNPQQKIFVAWCVVRWLLFEIQSCHLLSQSQALLAWDHVTWLRSFHINIPHGWVPTLCGSVTPGHVCMGVSTYPWLCLHSLYVPLDMPVHICDIALCLMCYFEYATMPAMYTNKNKKKLLLILLHKFLPSKIYNLLLFQCWKFCNDLLHGCWDLTYRYFRPVGPLKYPLPQPVYVPPVSFVEACGSSEWLYLASRWTSFAGQQTSRTWSQCLATKGVGSEEEIQTK